jgi:hypothetical protein
MYYVILSVLAFFVIGLPLSVLLLFKTNNGKSILEIFILTSIIGPLIINYLIFTLGYAGLLSLQNMLFATAAAIFVPLLSKSVRVSIGKFYFITRERFQHLKSSFGKMTLLEALPLSLIISTLAITAYSAFMLPPQLRDPQAVWLFYGKKIMETKTIPLYYGNGYDISWSGNYPPLFSFLAGYYFIILGNAVPTAFTNVSWLYGVLTFLATFLLAKELGLGKVALLSASLLTTSSIFTLELTNYGYVTVAWSFYVVTTCFYLVKLLRERNLYTSLIFGLSLGALLLSTYLSFIFVISLLVLLIISISMEKVFKRSAFLEFKHLAYGLIVAFVILLPWLIRNYVLIRNPVYPWFYDLLDGRGIDPSVMKMVPETQRIFNLHQLLVDNTFSALANEDLGYTLLVIGLIGAFYLILRSKGLPKFLGKLTLTFFMVLAASMMVIHGYERYFLMVTPLLAISAGYLLCRVFSSSRLKVLAVVSIIIFSLPNYVYLISLAPHGASFRETQLLYYIEGYIDNYVPSNAVILTNEIQLFFINREVINIYNTPEVLQNITLDVLINSLKSRNVTYILMNANIDIDYLGPESTKYPYFWRTVNSTTNIFRVLIDMPPYTFYEVENE